MKKLMILGILLFIVSIGIGYIFSGFLINRDDNFETKLNVNNIDEFSVTNAVELKTIEAVSEEEKVRPNTEFAIKQYYDECGHFKFEYAELPKELMNFTRQEIDDYYNDEYEVEQFENNSLLISKEINGFCDNHFYIKLGNEHIEVYKLSTDGSFLLYKETEITREYLPLEDIDELEEGIYVYR